MNDSDTPHQGTTTLRPIHTIRTANENQFWQLRDTNLHAGSFEGVVSVFKFSRLILIANLAGDFSFSRYNWITVPEIYCTRRRVRLDT